MPWTGITQRNLSRRSGDRRGVTTGSKRQQTWISDSWLRHASISASITRMATLHVRDVPDETYEALRERAAERRTSISAEAIRLLERALRTDRARVNELLAEIEATRIEARPGAPSPAELIRRDRDER